MVSATQVIKAILFVGVGLQHTSAAAPFLASASGGDGESGGRRGALVAVRTDVTPIAGSDGGNASSATPAADAAVVAAGILRRHRRLFSEHQKQDQALQLSQRKQQPPNVPLKHGHLRWQRRHLGAHQAPQSERNLKNGRQRSHPHRGRQQTAHPAGSRRAVRYSRHPVSAFRRSPHRRRHRISADGDEGLKDEGEQHRPRRRSGRHERLARRRRQHRPQPQRDHHHHQQQQQQQQQQQEQQQQQQHNNRAQQQPRRERQRRRRQQSSLSSASCSAYSDLAPSTLADPEWTVGHDLAGLQSFEFSCADGEFLVEALPFVVENYYTSRRETLSVTLIQSIRWTCSDGRQYQASEAGDFYTSAESTTWTGYYAAGAQASFSVAITGVSARYLPYPDCETSNRGVADTDRCYHLGALAFDGYDVVAGVAQEASIGTFADDEHFDVGTDTYTECEANSYATGFSAWQDGHGLLELRLVCAEYVAGVCEPPGLDAEGATPSPSSQRPDDDDDDDDDGGGGGEGSSAWPPSWWPADGVEGGTLLVIVAVVAFAALIVVCSLLKACARKLCCGFTDYDGDWGGSLEPADPAGGGGEGAGGDAGGDGVTDRNGDPAGGHSPGMAGGVGTSWGGGGGSDDVCTGGGGRGVGGNWGHPAAAAASSSSGNYGGYGYGGYGGCGGYGAAAALQPPPPTTAYAPNYGDSVHHSNMNSGNQGRVVPMSVPPAATAPPSPGGGGGSGGADTPGGYYSSVSSSQTPPSGGYSGRYVAGVLSPSRLDCPTAPPAAESEEDGDDPALRAALLASIQPQQQQQQNAGAGGGDDDDDGLDDELYLPVAMPVPD